MKKIVLFIVLLLSQCCLAQEFDAPTDWKCEGLKGKVKKLTQTIKGLKKPNESVSVTEFNTRGYIVSMSNKDKEFGVNTVKVVNETVVQYSEYKNNKRNIVTIERKNKSGYTFFQEWHSPQETTINMGQDVEREFDMIEKKTYNAMGSIEKGYVQVKTKTDDILYKAIEMECTTTYTYDKKGIKTQRRIDCIPDNKIEEYVNDNLEFDKQGNVLKQITYDSDGVPEIETGFVYEYYN